MSNVSEFSTTAASNNSAAPDGFPEGMSPASLNDSSRELMAALAKWYQDQQGTITTGGTTTAYTLTTNNAHAALNDIPLFAFQVNATNTGAATLNVDSLGAKSMNLNGAALEAGDIVADEIVLAVYNPDNDVFDLFKSGLSQSTIKTDTINELTSANGVVIDSVTLKDGGITATGTVVAPTVDIDAGAIDGTTIGANSAAAGTFTTLTTSSNVSVTGNISVSGTVDGRDIATDGAKLDNIEANADVTDATNVNAAGAVMNTDTSTASMSFVIDEDGMGSNLDTKVPTQQSVKKYVDDTVTAIGALTVSGSPVANDFARFTSASAIEGRSYAEVRADLSLEVGTDVQAELSGASLTSATVATGDKVLIQDADDTDNLKTVTAQSIADLAAGTFINNYLSGLTLSNGTDSDHDIDVAVGIAADSTNAEYLELTSALTKLLDATWVAGDGNGGMASGASLPTSGTVHIFVVSVGGSVDVMGDTSATCANGVANNSVTAFRRIASIPTDGSANLKGFHQSTADPDKFILDVFVQDVSTTVSASTAQTLTLTSLPSGVVFEGIFSMSIAGTGASYAMVTALVQTDTAVSASVYTMNLSAGNESTINQVELNTSKQFRYRQDAASNTSLRIHTMGWIDSRGQ